MMLATFNRIKNDHDCEVLKVSLMWALEMAKNHLWGVVTPYMRSLASDRNPTMPSRPLGPGRWRNTIAQANTLRRSCSGYKLPGHQRNLVTVSARKGVAMKKELIKGICKQITAFSNKACSTFKPLTFFERYVVAVTSTITLLLFLILVRDFISPYKVNAFVEGSVYESPEPVEFGNRRIQVDVN